MEQHQQSEAIKHRAQRTEAYQFMQISIHTGISHKLDFSFEIFARAVFQFEGNQICSKAVGSDFADFRTQFVDDERAFGFVRIQVNILHIFNFFVFTQWRHNVLFKNQMLIFYVPSSRCLLLLPLQSGDEMSKRTKFLFVTWLGPNVSTMKRARLSSDKALVKEIIMVYINRSKKTYHNNSPCPFRFPFTFIDSQLKQTGRTKAKGRQRWKMSISLIRNALRKRKKRCT